MAITRKPKAKPKAKPRPASVDVDKLISKGGSVPSLVTESEQRQAYVQLRLSRDVLGQIDSCVKTRPVKTPRHTWLLEAIHEKLKRESPSG